MEVDQTQELEIEALKAIYGDDFQETPPSKVWKVRDSPALSRAIACATTNGAYVSFQRRRSDAVLRVLPHIPSSSFESNQMTRIYTTVLGSLCMSSESRRSICCEPKLIHAGSRKPIPGFYRR